MRGRMDASRAEGAVKRISRRTNRRLRNRRRTRICFDDDGAVQSAMRLSLSGGPGTTPGRFDPATSDPEMALWRAHQLWRDHHTPRFTMVVVMGENSPRAICPAQPVDPQAAFVA